MAQVTVNPDNTFTIALVPREQKLVTRWASEHGRTTAAQIEDTINGFLANKANDYRNVDGPKMREKYDALDGPKRAQIDAILGL